MSQARQRMRMRLRYSSPQVVGEDPWGSEIPDSGGEAPLETSCYAWHPTDVRQVMDGNKDGVFGAVRMIVPNGTDIDEASEVHEVTDRRGVVLFDGPMRVTAVTRRSGYLAVMCRVARSNRKGA